MNSDGLDFELIATHSCYAYVRTCLPISEAVHRLEKFFPRDPGWAWKISRAKRFPTGRTNGCQCESDPDFRNYIFESAVKEENK